MSEREFQTKIETTYMVKIYMSGPIEIAKQVIRKYCMNVGLCVTIEPTTFVYTGGEEQGFVIGLLQFPKFPKNENTIDSIAVEMAKALIEETYQWSALIVTPTETRWINTRPE